MLKAPVPQVRVSDDFPYYPVDVFSVISQIGWFRRPAAQKGQYHDLLKPDQGKKKVVIVLDGLGSSSAVKPTSTLVNEIRRLRRLHKFDVCEYSYQGIDCRRYTPTDTASTDLTTLVEQLNDYVQHYSQSEKVVLVGYSLGGLVASQWAHLYKNDFDNVASLILVASPVRLKSDRAFCSKRDEYNEAVCLHLEEFLDQYTVNPESLHTLLPVTILRCETDELLNDCVYQFSDRPRRDRSFELPPFEKVTEGLAHAKIFDNRRVSMTVIDVLRQLT